MEDEHLDYTQEQEEISRLKAQIAKLEAQLNMIISIHFKMMDKLL